MPKLMAGNDEIFNIKGAGSFQFSGVKIEDLGSTEYTLVCIAVDLSGSVDSFVSSLINSLDSIVDACRKSPRSENLMIRLISFNDKVDEIHGFKLIKDIDTSQYKSLSCGGMTSLFDAVFSGIGSVVTYSESLMTQDFNVNGIVFVITDGCDNKSKTTTSMIKKQIQDAVSKESIESLMTILIGVNVADCQDILNEVKDESGMNHFIDIGSATKDTLAKLASFVSKSISSQSQALGTGTSAQLVF